jgi:hypothetical protein
MTKVLCDRIACKYWEEVDWQKKPVGHCGLGVIHLTLQGCICYAAAKAQKAADYILNQRRSER